VLGEIFPLTHFLRIVRAIMLKGAELTLKLFGLAQLHAPVRRLVSFATPIMRELAEATLQANQLVVFDRGAAVVIAQQEAPGYWGISIRVGSHISLFDTGSGHVLLAFRSPDDERQHDDRRTSA
jgi:DNA-binding IclR family transcriptional regulator